MSILIHNMFKQIPDSGKQCIDRKMIWYVIPIHRSYRPIKLGDSAHTLLFTVLIFGLIRLDCFFKGYDFCVKNATDVP